MEDIWKRLFSLPCFLKPINTGNLNGFMEDGRYFQKYSFVSDFFCTFVTSNQSIKYDRHHSAESDPYQHS